MFAISILLTSCFSDKEIVVLWPTEWESQEEYVEKLEDSIKELIIARGTADNLYTFDIISQKEINLWETIDLEITAINEIRNIKTDYEWSINIVIRNPNRVEEYEPVLYDYKFSNEHKWKIIIKDILIERAGTVRINVWDKDIWKNWTTDIIINWIDDSISSKMNKLYTIINSLEREIKLELLVVMKKIELNSYNNNKKREFLKTISTALEKYPDIYNTFTIDLIDSLHFEYRINQDNWSWIEDELSHLIPISITCENELWITKCYENIQEKIELFLNTEDKTQQKNIWTDLLTILQTTSLSSDDILMFKWILTQIIYENK